MANPDAPLSGGGQLATIIDFQSTKVVDDTTLQLVLKTPYAILDSLLAEYTVGIIPGGEFDPANPVGTGAFAYKSFEAGKTSTSPSTPTTGVTRPSSTSSRSRTSPTTTPRSTRSRPARSRPLDNLPYNLVDTIKGAGGGVLIADGRPWVPFTMRVDWRPSTTWKVRQAMRLIVTARR